MSGQRGPCSTPCGELFLAVMILALIALLALRGEGPIIPDEDDCLARGKSPTCWREVIRSP